MVEVLTQKYNWPFEQARSFAAFLLPMLAYEPDERATAAQCLKHPWVNKPIVDMRTRSPMSDLGSPSDRSLRNSSQ